MKLAFKLSPYLFLMPALLFLFLYLLYPLVYTLIISFYKWDGLSPIRDAIYIGIRNYVKLFSDELFYMSLRNTIIYVIGTLIFQNFFGLTLALSLFYSRMRLSNVFRTIIFFPAVLSPVVVGLVWKFIYAKTGIINEVLRSIGLGFLTRIWLGVPVFPILAITIVSIWQWSGYNMVLYYAGLQGINEDMLEAARIDGASSRQVMTKIVIPMLSGVATIVMLLNIIGGFKVFDIVYVMTRGGPAHQSEVLASYMFLQSFMPMGPSDFSYSAAITVILTTIIFLIATFRLKLFERKD